MLQQNTTIKMKLFSPHTGGKHKLVQPRCTTFSGEKLSKGKNKLMQMLTTIMC